MEEGVRARPNSSKRNKKGLSPIPPLVKRYYEDQDFYNKNKNCRQSYNQSASKKKSLSREKRTKAKINKANETEEVDVYKIINKVKEKIDQLETKERPSISSYVIPEKGDFSDPYELLQAYTENQNHYCSEVNEERYESESHSTGVKFNYDEEDIATEYTVENDALLPKCKLADDPENNYIDFNYHNYLPNEELNKRTSKKGKSKRKLKNPRKSKMSYKLSDHADKSNGTLVKSLLFSLFILGITVSCLIFWTMMGSKNTGIKSPLHK